VASVFTAPLNGLCEQDPARGKLHVFAAYARCHAEGLPGRVVGDPSTALYEHSLRSLHLPWWAVPG
jgi:hypothetical protein